jgi:hypothetical protein
MYFSDVILIYYILYSKYVKNFDIGIFSISYKFGSLSNKIKLFRTCQEGIEN